MQAKPFSPGAERFLPVANIAKKLLQEKEVALVGDLASFPEGCQHDKIVLLGKAKLNAIEVLIFNTLIDSYISHEEFVSVNIVLKEYNQVKE